MNHFFIIYIFLLFFFFSYQLTFLTNDFKNKTLLYCSCSFIYSVILYLSYPYFHKEGFEIEIQSKKGLQPLVDIVSKVMGNTEKSSDYKIKNEFDLNSKDIIDENYKEIVEGDENTIYNAELEAKMSSDQNSTNNADEWIISPVIPKNNYNRVKQQNLYCAADFNSVTACCDQPPAKVPPEYICGKEKPDCKGYVEFERWGTCEKKGKTVEPFDNNSSCRQTSELYSNGEYSIIGRFGKFVIWNMHKNTQTFAKEKINIIDAGYMFLHENLVPTMNATTFDEYNIQECIIPIVADYVENKMPPSQKSKDSTIIFTGTKSYSNTLNSANIINYKTTSFQWNENSELTMGNVFFILIDPTY